MQSIIIANISPLFASCQPAPAAEGISISTVTANLIASPQKATDAPCLLQLQPRSQINEATTEPASIPFNLHSEPTDPILPSVEGDIFHTICADPGTVDYHGGLFNMFYNSFPRYRQK